MSSEVNPALVAAIVAQVLSALQHMTIDGPSAAVESNVNTNGHSSDAEDDGYVVQFSSPPPSPAPSSVHDVAIASIATTSPSTTPVAELAAANTTLPAAVPSNVPDMVTLPMNTAPVATTTPPPVHNMIPAHGSWYMVSSGLAVGVFCGWHIVSPLIIGVSSACFKKYPSEAMATAAFEEAQAAGVVNTVV
ncbi:hypothetical protein AX14_003414 [Amanita brunnescens Koide BX004]|nr:hypothetical protein AX14_003414 [Amanita brunnescens Koide BX004]